MTDEQRIDQARRSAVVSLTPAPKPKSPGHRLGIVCCALAALAIRLCPIPRMSRRRTRWGSWSGRIA